MAARRWKAPSRRTIDVLLVAGLLLLLFFLFLMVSGAFREMITQDRIGQIDVTLDHTLDRTAYDRGYDLIAEFSKRFPEIKIRDRQIRDGWGKEIIVKIKPVRDHFEIVINSAGSDGKYGTEDDIVRTMNLSDTLGKKYSEGQ